MYSITVRNNILIAHSLPGEVFGPAQNMHGATYVVDAEFFAKKVNEYNICIEDKYTVDVPSAFTPGVSGQNDVIYLNGHGIKELIYFRIYNRWGELVFETNEISKGWDGVYKGAKQGIETFVYQAKVKFYNDKFEVKGGDITLIR